MDHIRNFCIIAHIDHGKSTLADRLIQRCGAVEDREFRDQILDSMDLERERGITIKANTVTLPYTARDGKTYELNLIDTPGHVDFSHEVRRSLMSCEGALLVVDASQGVEAQTVANLYLAMEFGLTVVPVINKIDLPSADVERVMEEIDRDLGLDPFESVQVSAKMGTGIDELLEAIVTKLPPPKGDPEAPLKALLFDAQYDSYRGAVLLVRLFDGKLKTPTRVRLMHSDSEHKVEEVGNQTLKRVPVPELSAGEVGYVLAGMKSLAGLAIGDTLTEADRPAAEPVPGYREAKPVVFSSIYPMDTERLRGPDEGAREAEAQRRVPHLREGRLGRPGLRLPLRVPRAAPPRRGAGAARARVRPVADPLRAVGPLSDRAQQRQGGLGRQPDLLSRPRSIKEAYEPYIKAAIMTPERYLGTVMELCRERRGVETTYSFLAAGRMEVTSQLPLAEVLFDFYDRLKSITQGYGSFDYELLDYRLGDMVKVDILVNGEKVDALSQLVHREFSRPRALRYCERLAKKIPRQQFKIAIQGAIGGQIIARSTINPFRKDVTAKCYGGDISRKRKLLEKQKEGKKKMKMVGNVEIPQSAFVSVLKTEDDDDDE